MTRLTVLAAAEARNMGCGKNGNAINGQATAARQQLAETGGSAEDVAGVLGRRSSKTADHYSREADRSRRSNAAIRKLRPLEKGEENEIRRPLV